MKILKLEREEYLYLLLLLKNHQNEIREEHPHVVKMNASLLDKLKGTCNCDWMETHPELGHHQTCPAWRSNLHVAGPMPGAAESLREVVAAIMPVLEKQDIGEGYLIHDALKRLRAALAADSSSVTCQTCGATYGPGFSSYCDCEAPNPYREDMRRIGEALGLHANVSDVGHILGEIDERKLCAIHGDGPLDMKKDAECIVCEDNVSCNNDKPGSRICYRGTSGCTVPHPQDEP